MKRVFDFTTDHKAQKLYDELRDLKERFRNPLSHGAFEKRGLSLFVHMPHLGAIPTRLSRFSNGIHFSRYPLESVSFEGACRLFDMVDRLFQESRMLRFGYEFAVSGLDVSFDPRSISEYRAAATSDQEFQMLLGRLATVHDW